MPVYITLPNIENPHSKKNIIITCLFIIFSNELNLYFPFIEFNIILVSCPVYATTPIIHSVFYKLQPLYKKHL
jgi:hypothetical protein